MSFRLFFRHKQHLVAADRQCEAAVALEHNLLRSICCTQKSSLEFGYCGRIWLCNFTNINKYTLA